MHIDIRDMPAMRLATVRHIGPYAQISKAFETLEQAARPLSLFEKPGALMVGVYYDDPRVTAPDTLRSDAAVVVSPHERLPPSLVEQRLPAGRYATATHIGPYENLGQSWGALMAWVPANGHRLGVAPSYEIYPNNPMTVPQDQLRTEMYLSIA